MSDPDSVQDLLEDYGDAQIGEDEVKSAARSCMAIVLILGALLAIAIIFALVALLA